MLAFGGEGNVGQRACIVLPSWLTSTQNIVSEARSVSFASGSGERQTTRERSQDVRQGGLEGHCGSRWRDSRVRNPQAPLGQWSRWTKRCCGTMRHRNKSSKALKKFFFSVDNTKTGGEWRRRSSPPRQPNQPHTTKQQIRLRLTTKTRTTPKTTTNKTTTIRYSASFN